MTVIGEMKDEQIDRLESEAAAYRARIATMGNEIDMLRRMVKRAVPLLARVAAGGPCSQAAGDLYNEMKPIAVEQDVNK